MSVCVQQETLTKHLSADLGLNAVSDPKVLVCLSLPTTAGQNGMEWSALCRTRTGIATALRWTAILCRDGSSHSRRQTLFLLAFVT